MRYSYFGNTSNRVKQVLYNFEAQLLLFEELFCSANENETWENDSILQIRYLELLQKYHLLESKNKTTHLGTKDARVKSAPLEDYGLINRKEKCLTKQGYELLDLLKNEAYKIYNDFLQIDLISLFFLKASLNFSKDSTKNLFYKYLDVFRIYDGELDMQIFKYLPLVENFSNTKDFINEIQKENFLESFVDFTHFSTFLQDIKHNTLQSFYFKTAKGDKIASIIIEVLKKYFLPLREQNEDKNFLQSIKILNKIKQFKSPYLRYILKNTKKEKEQIQALKDFISGDLKDFAKRFFTSIFLARIDANLEDYLDLNRRYLNLSGIFEFSRDKVCVSLVFKLIMKHSKYNIILQDIATQEVSKMMLYEYFNDDEFKTLFKDFNIIKPQDLQEYKNKQDKLKLDSLLKNHLTKDKIIELLGLFKNRKNDEIISKETTNEAKIPTIFEYIIAIAWCYVDNHNLDRILEAGLSLDSNMLPKSHAVGGNADFVYPYPSHTLMIEATLTEKTNQRRAEMESVSRHLGNILLSLDSKRQAQSYAIFVAPYLDKNVLNDFRSRLYCYFENEVNFIKGMKILPLSTEDLICILQSNIDYNNLYAVFQNLIESTNDWGSKWYEQEIKPSIKSLYKSTLESK
ncbi:AlwI family type II restriction endonuclease [uncultured Campylobacter sp.]|uniref:AlwI family type II restriction endonuclease n=1 Tax=uncultured Campylobacter sp. TaxID=218934 RepID=UPI002608D27F|nr:AlwI family type II restriction endonuclease [uncultured Campylobacter sp.]